MINSIEEAIAHTKEVAENWKSQLVNCVSEEGRCKCKECATEHLQLVAWLEELKDYREGKRTCENCKHQNKAEDQYPCSICRCNHPNMFEWERENEDK